MTSRAHSADSHTTPRDATVRGWTMPRVVARGKADLDVQAAFGTGVGAEGCLVGGGDGPDDGQAKSVPVAVAGAGGGEPLEGLEEPVDFGGRDGCAAVGYQQDGAVVPHASGNFNRAGRCVVLHRIVEDVGGEPLNQVGVAAQRPGRSEAWTRSRHRSIWLAAVRRRA